ncbi:MAG: NADP-dependent oxidoreductase [Woeseiaceae bacterium]|nr:NADP-dependent oxidoreductase [Woeseiaceae bacterium]
MPEAVNRQIRLTSRPAGWVSQDNFTLTEEAVPEPADGEVLVRNVYLSVDPYMRGRMDDVKSYVPPFQVGEVLEAGVVGQVIASRNESFAEGDYVSGMLGWENYSVTDGNGLHKIPSGPAPLSYHLGILGMPGMTAWIGLMKIAAAKPDETVFVSAASGAVGSIVGQLAKIHGCRVTGCAGSDEKIDLCTGQFGYDAAFNYRKSDNLPKSIAEICPDGIDVDFENVGGDIFEAVLWNMRNFGRVALCGMISNYNDDKLQPGPRGMMVVIGRRLTIRGFIVTDDRDACLEYVQKASKWLAEGRLHYRESIAEGIENAPQAFIDVLKGNNVGKQIVRLADDRHRTLLRPPTDRPTVGAASSRD